MYPGCTLFIVFHWLLVTPTEQLTDHSGVCTTGRIRLSVSTVNRTYELSGITHVTPFRKYGKHSTGPSTYGPWVHTYSKLFFCKSVLVVCSSQSNEICTYGRVSRGSLPRVRRYGLPYLQTVEYDHCHLYDQMVLLKVYLVISNCHATWFKMGREILQSHATFWENKSCMCCWYRYHNAMLVRLSVEDESIKQSYWRPRPLFTKQTDVLPMSWSLEAARLGVYLSQLF